MRLERSIINCNFCVINRQAWKYFIFVYEHVFVSQNVRQQPWVRDWPGWDNDNPEGLVSNYLIKSWTGKLNFIFEKSISFHPWIHSPYNVAVLCDTYLQENESSELNLRLLFKCYLSHKHLKLNDIKKASLTNFKSRMLPWKRPLICIACLKFLLPCPMANELLWMGAKSAHLDFDYGDWNFESALPPPLAEMLL